MLSAAFASVRFNSQASYEARLIKKFLGRQIQNVSIHRPHTRPDREKMEMRILFVMFQFTGLIRGPT